MEHKVRSITSDHNQIRAQVVTTQEQLLHAYAIRAICFMEEHGVPAHHEFDGNDYQATHVIVYRVTNRSAHCASGGSRISPSSSAHPFARPIATRTS